MSQRRIVVNYTTSAQIAPEDLAALKAAGFDTILCNRPDSENPPELQSDTMRQVAEAAGLTFHYVPLSPGQMSVELIADHRAAMETAKGQTLAYCASGMRSSLLWAGAVARDFDDSEILQKLQEAGFDPRPAAGLLAWLKQG